MQTITRTFVLALACTALFLTGCKSTSTPAGVHPTAIPVGGGVDFEFEAPADGVIFIVDSRNNELVSSRSIRMGDVYRLGDNSLELVRLIGLREHGPSFTLKTDYDDGKQNTFPEVKTMKSPTFAVFFATLEQMQLDGNRLQQRAEPGPEPETEPSIDDLEKILIQ
jgi:hypothetical protein